jgi:hypothetical protein
MLGLSAKREDKNNKKSNVNKKRKKISKLQKA